MSEVWSVGSYERIAARFAPVQDHLTGLLAPRADERVLDVATGTGEVAIRAARTGATVTAIDIAEPMLEKARRRAEEEGVSISFDLGDVEYLPYEDACFDVLLSNPRVQFGKYRQLGGKIVWRASDHKFVTAKVTLADPAP